MIHFNHEKFILTKSEAMEKLTRHEPNDPPDFAMFNFGDIHVKRCDRFLVRFYFSRERENVEEEEEKKNRKQKMSEQNKLMTTPQRFSETD